MGEKEKHKVILKCLDKNKEGCSITEIVEKTNLSRSYVRTALATLYGSGKINLRKIGVAKVYFLRGDEKWQTNIRGDLT